MLVIVLWLHWELSLFELCRDVPQEETGLGSVPRIAALRSNVPISVRQMKHLE